MNKKSIVIIFQGPIISSGLSGNGNFVEGFECIINIQNLISSSKHLVTSFILSTWKSKDLIDLPDDVVVLTLDDPGPVNTFGSIYASNDYRQAYGCFIGIEYAITNFNPDYILKVRTDQYIDLPKMINHMIDIDARLNSYQNLNQSGFLYFPYMLTFSPYSVGDFYIGGHASDMKNLFEAQLKLSNHTFSNYFGWIHSDIILKYAFCTLRSRIDLEDIYYFPNIPFNLKLQHPNLERVLKKINFKLHSGVLRLWVILLRQSISFFPKDIFESMSWRGSQMNSSKHFFGDFYKEWEQGYDDFEKYILKRQPNLFISKKRVTYLDRKIHFLPEKKIEIKNNKYNYRRYLFVLLRIFLTPTQGILPKEFIIALSEINRLYLKVKIKFLELISKVKMISFI